MAEFDVDLFVIGGGSGGVRAARIAAGHGARVMVAEEYRMGGTCVIRGCVPKKLFVLGSHVHQEIEDAAGFGWSIAAATFDWPTLVANKDKEIARLEGIYTANVEKSGGEVVKTRAVLEDAHTIRLGTGQTVRAGTILIATGSAPNHGAMIPGIEHVISSNEAFHLPELPKRVVIQGGGYIALEFAGIFAGFGSDVTVIYRGDNILRGFDEDVRSHVRAEMEKAGITVLTGCTVSKVDRHGKEFTTHLSGGSSIASDLVMFAIGRHPNVANLGLEKAGVALNPANGGIAVDAWSRTSTPNIYAIGDVTHRINLTPVAIREGHAFADTVFGKRPVQVDYATIPTAVFSQPEVGTVGLTEAEARAQFSHVDIYKTDFRPIKATMSGRDTRVLMKLVVDGSSDRVVGCHIVGDAAAEIVQALAIAVKMKATKADFDATFALHPTAAEELVTMRTPSARYVRDAAAE
ncbi:glutathione-disulfide reductase [Bradyrhizobium sp. dw_78]|uniref:glutathione-disulfide reductase n=1 Tax=Bradyrhizobium sp. dw_78 TaxID=2719793 RepID=UPI001BD491CD|nr:glutathione-disulfide reductase [Bradyrhizobium sp. dw_78]